MQYAPVSASTYTGERSRTSSPATPCSIDADHMATSKSSIGGRSATRSLPRAGGTRLGMWVWSLGMNGASGNKDAAWQFIQWATKEFLTAVRSTAAT